MNLFPWAWHWPPWGFALCKFPFHLPSPHSLTHCLCYGLILVLPTGWGLCPSWHLPVLFLLLTAQPLTSHPTYTLPNSPTDPSSLSLNATYLHWSFLTLSPQSQLSWLIIYFFIVPSYCIVIGLITVHDHVRIVITQHCYISLSPCLNSL